MRCRPANGSPTGGSSGTATATSTGWDKLPPAPPIPDDVVAQTRERYVTAYERLAGEPFGAWLDRVA